MYGYTDISSILIEIVQIDSLDTIDEMTVEKKSDFGKMLDAVTSLPVLGIPKNGLRFHYLLQLSTMEYFLSKGGPSLRATDRL